MIRAVRASYWALCMPQTFLDEFEAMMVHSGAGLRSRGQELPDHSDWDARVGVTAVSHVAEELARPTTSPRHHTYITGHHDIHPAENS